MSKTAVAALATAAGFATGASSVIYVLTNRKIMTRVLHELFVTKDFTPTDEEVRVITSFASRFKASRPKTQQH